MSTPDSCNKGASKSNDDGVSEMNDKLHNMSTVDNEDSISICANCGKEGSDVNNTCNKCKMVKYCNAACKKKHRHKHKKDCEEYVRLAAENAAESHDIELFKHPPSLNGYCPICFQLLPTVDSGRRYKTCCGKTICSGCNYAPVYDHQGNKVDKKKCPFCRTPSPETDKEIVERKRKRAEAGDAIAIYSLGCDYRDGRNGLAQDYTKAFKLWHRAGELGHANAYCSIGFAYYLGRGVERDTKKSIRYYELAAMGGNETARYNLGIEEENAGNHERALKHYMIAVRSVYHLIYLINSLSCRLFASMR